MWFARDVRDSVIAKLSSSFSTMLTTIDSERSTTTPKPVRIAYDESLKQLPEIIVLLGDSDITQNRGNYKAVQESFNLRVTCFVSGNSIAESENNAENYIEASIRLLQGYSNETAQDKNYFLQCTRVLRDPAYTENGQHRKDVAIEFNAVRNYL